DYRAHCVLQKPVDTGEEDGDLLPLVLERAPRLDNAVRQVFRGVRLRRTESPGCVRGGRCAQELATPAAELFVRFVEEAARRTGGRERRSALRAEPAALSILGPASGALHEASTLAHRDRRRRHAS